MTEIDQQQEGGGLVGERGTTSIADRIVAEIAGISAQEVPGVHMGGGASRASDSLLGSVTGSQSTSKGISVEVGTTETALDLTMALDYGRDILETVGEVRRRITESIQYMTGLKVMELNVTVDNIVFPEDGDDDQSSGSESSETAETSGPPTRTMPRSELRPGAREREYTSVDPTSRTHSESESGPVPEEPVRAENEPVEQDETVEIRPGDLGDDEKTSGSGSEDDTRTSRRQRRESQSRGEEQSGREEQSSSGEQGSREGQSSSREEQGRREEQRRREERKRREEQRRREEKRRRDEE